ncbi:uncharacterized protein LOC132058199 [Lycium ferocissimum]|uniref:uncharacterized protein LOC132058199 n=1 Tax=Lycium ferocissimum TaxID=112874 RepID=UPI002815C2D7|nr:uncharacterized protein LOC132058199 [Lycium ferocissimum]
MDCQRDELSGVVWKKRDFAAKVFDKMSLLAIDFRKRSFPENFREESFCSDFNSDREEWLILYHRRSIIVRNQYSIISEFIWDARMGLLKKEIACLYSLSMQ